MAGGIVQSVDVYLYICLIVTVFYQDQHVGASDRFVDDSLVCKPAPIVSSHWLHMLVAFR